MSELVCPLWRPANPPPITDQIAERYGTYQPERDAGTCTFRHRETGEPFTRGTWDTAADARNYRCVDHNRRPHAYTSYHGPITRREKLAQQYLHRVFAYDPAHQRATAEAEYIRTRRWHRMDTLPIPDIWPEDHWSHYAHIWVLNRPPSPTLHTDW